MEDYVLKHTGEQIDEAIDKVLNNSSLITGTQTVTIASNTSYMEEVKLNLGFEPTINTGIILTLRRTTYPTPYDNIMCYANYRDQNVYVVMLMGGNYGAELEYIPAGTYYIDWLVTNQG